MDTRIFSLEGLVMSTLHQLMDIPEEVEKAFNAPTRTYVRDAQVIALTLTDVKEMPRSYAFTVDMPEVKLGEINVQVEDNNMLVVSGERKRDREELEEEGVKYLKMERRMGKFIRKFTLPENADVNGITTECKDEVLTVTIIKKPPPELKKPKTIQVNVA